MGGGQREGAVFASASSNDPILAEMLLSSWYRRRMTFAEDAPPEPFFFFWLHSEKEAETDTVKYAPVNPAGATQSEEREG